MAEYVIARLRRKLKHGERIVSITAYDYFTALVARAAEVDFVLVGDSLGNVVQGQGSTVGVTLEQMIYHTRIVCRHFPAERVLLDMPFGTFKVDPADAVRNCLRAFQESGCGGVKLEGASSENLAAIDALLELGVPVLGHLGLLPQRVYSEGGYRMQGRTPEQAERLLADARALERAGAFGVVLECVVPEVAAEITRVLDIPTIGIGSGPATDGQIIVIHDILGLLPGDPPSFAHQYAHLYQAAEQAAKSYASDVHSGAFPQPAAPRQDEPVYGGAAQPPRQP